MKRAVFVLAAALALAGAAAQPAPAAIHEIVAAWCSGKGALEPPGVTREGSKNFAQPVFAGGAVTVHPYLDGLLIDFDFDRPQMKVSGTGGIVQIGTTPAGPLYIEAFVLDHPAFDHCAKLRS